MLHKANSKGGKSKKGVMDLDLDNPPDMPFNLVGVLLLLLLFQIFYCRFSYLINLSHPTQHLYHPTHHVQVYKFSVPVKELLDLTNHPVTPNAIYGQLSRQSQRDSEAAASEAAEAVMFTPWEGLKSPPMPSSNAKKYPPPAQESLAVAPVTPEMTLSVVVAKDAALDKFLKFMDRDTTEKAMKKSENKLRKKLIAITGQ